MTQEVVVFRLFTESTYIKLLLLFLRTCYKLSVAYRHHQDFRIAFVAERVK